METAVNRSLVTIGEDQTALAAAQLMKESQAGCIVVVDGAGRLTGIITGRDLVLKVMAPGKSPTAMHVREVMSPSPTTATADLDLRSMARILARARVRRLPIVDADNRPIGIITLEDFLVHAADVLHSIGTAVSSYLTVARMKSIDLAKRG